MRFRTFPIIACMAVQGMKISSPIQELESAVKRLDNTVGGWNGSPLTLVPMALQARKLQKQIANTGVALQKLGKRSIDIDEQILVDSHGILDGLDHIMTTMEGSMDKFSAIPMGIPVMFGIIKSFEISTNKAMRLSVSGGSPGAKQQLQEMQEQAKERFAKTVAAFEENLTLL